MPECDSVTMPNEPDGNSDPDDQMEMSPSLAADLKLCSDHNPVKLTFQLKFTTLHNSVTTHTDWTKFQNYLKNQIDYTSLKINSNTDIEIAVEKFTKNLQNAHRFATKTVKKSTATYIHTLIKSELNRIEKLIKKLDKNNRQKDQTEELEALNTEDGTLWRKAKIKRKKAQKIPALLGENGFAYSDSIKAKIIALSLEKQFSLNDLSHRETENKVKKSTENFSFPQLTNNQIDNLKCIQPSQRQLLFTGTSSYSASETIPQDPDGLPPTQPLPPKRAADHPIPRTEIILYHQRASTGEKAPFGAMGLKNYLITNSPKNFFRENM
ncbi:hypothetical protein AVEN_245383-1 [Araneus ventricosus]|uniref:Uncharacterized protein n=1 Tax=Araneus ventricosus TaxID=182803 RepID=A0A4Y2TU46_ARAVE|nr:hypothetical protein AVEN_245383-1 [Araneus ventricosus]